MSPFTVTIDVNTPFNLGYLSYLMGQPEPSVEDAPEEHDGWAMAKAIPDLAHIRRVFEPNSQNPDDPAFLITVSRATPADDIDDDDLIAVADKIDAKVGDRVREITRVKA